MSKTPKATGPEPPFPVPRRLPPSLERVLAYWRGLLRGAADMPFWDDVRLTDLPDLSDRLFLIDAFDQPERFRFAEVGARLSGRDLPGRFLDDVALEAPFEYLRAQCTTTVEAAAPTYFKRQGAGAGYRRLLLPLWGDGRISMLLGAVDLD